MHLELEYGSDIEGYKVFYDGADLVEYTDSNYPGNNKNRKSLISYIYYLNRMVVSWPNKKVRMVTISSIKAEYVTPRIRSKQAVSIKRLLNDI